MKVTLNLIIVKQDLRNLTGKASSLQNHMKGKPTKLLIIYEAFLHAIWAPCEWHECVCCMCVSVSELNGGVRRGVQRGMRGVRRARRAAACGVRRRAACDGVRRAAAVKAKTYAAKPKTTRKLRRLLAAF